MIVLFLGGNGGLLDVSQYEREISYSKKFGVKSRFFETENDGNDSEIPGTPNDEEKSCNSATFPMPEVVDFSSIGVSPVKSLGRAQKAAGEFAASRSSAATSCSSRSGFNTSFANNSKSLKNNIANNSSSPNINVATINFSSPNINVGTNNSSSSNINVANMSGILSVSGVDNFASVNTFVGDTSGSFSSIDVGNSFASISSINLGIGPVLSTSINSDSNYGSLSNNNSKISSSSATNEDEAENRGLANVTIQAENSVSPSNIAGNSAPLSSTTNIADPSSFSTAFVDHNSSEGKSWFSISELMADTFPAKSRIVYLKAYKSFERFLKSKNQFVAGAPPTEEMVLNYFHFVKNDCKWAPTTMWSCYARINACVKRMFGFSLKSFVRVSEALKSFESGHRVKKASIFTPQQVIFIVRITWMVFIVCLQIVFWMIECFGLDCFWLL